MLAVNSFYHSTGNAVLVIVLRIEMNLFTLVVFDS